MLKYQVRSGDSTSTLQRKNKRHPAAIVDESDGNSSNGSTLGSIPSFSPASSSGFSSNGSLARRGRSNSLSSLSSTSSTNECHIEWGPLKVHTGSIRAETDYKTLNISTITTAADVIHTILNKYRMSSRDPRLYHLVMQIHTKREGVAVTNTLVLDRDCKPLELQRCHPKDMSSFALQMTSGTLVRVFDYAVSPESNYKSIMVSKQTTCHEAIRLLLHISRLPIAPEQFVLVGVLSRDQNDEKPQEFILPRDAFLVSTVTGDDGNRFEVHLRRFANERLQSLANKGYRQSNGIAVGSESSPCQRKIFDRRNSMRRRPPSSPIPDRRAMVPMEAHPTATEICAAQFDKQCIL